MPLNFFKFFKNKNNLIASKQHSTTDSPIKFKESGA